MRLYISGNSPYARKTRIVARETGLISQIEEITVTSLEDLQEAGPGEKIPVLICEDGARLCESMIINAYLNELAHGQLLPKKRCTYYITKIKLPYCGLLNMAFVSKECTLTFLQFLVLIAE